MTGGLTKVGSKSHNALGNSPYGNELLLELVKTAISAEKMGQGEQTDLLTVSFSSNDIVGHCWGPDSQEVLDITLRSDVIPPRNCSTFSTPGWAKDNTSSS